MTNSPSLVNRNQLFLPLAFCLLAFTPIASAATAYNFSGTSGLWSDTATWTPTGTPGASDSLSLTGSASGEIGLDTSYTISSFTSTKTGTLSFTDQAPGTPSLNITGNLLIQSNPGTVYFGSGTNLTVTGTTIVRGGSLLRIDGTSTFTGNMTLGSGSSGSGILGLGYGDLNVTLGTGAGQLQIGGATDGGGFAAFNANRSVTFNGGADLTSLTLVLGHSTATHTITITNNFTALGGVTVVDSAAAIDAKLSGNLSGSVSFTKTGTSTLELSGTNTYASGTGTRVNGGVLLVSSAGALSTASRLVLAGGVLGLGAVNYTWAIGSGASQLTILGDSIGSGFAAYGADRIVNLGSGTALSWASTSGFFTNANGGSADHMILNVAESGYKLTFQNAINLNAAERKITVGDGSASIDAAMTGVLSGTGASALRKQGLGTLELTNSNTYLGGTTIAEGTLLANNTTGSATGSGNVNLSAGATLGGTGTIGGLVITAGTTSTLSPGSSSASTIYLTGGLNAANGATFNFTLGTTSDQLNLGSGVFTGSTLDQSLRFNFTNGGGLLAGVDYTLLNFASASGLELTDLFAASTPAGFAVDYFTINGTDLLVRFAAIPEPGTAGLLLFGLAAGLLFRRRSH